MKQPQPLQTLPLHARLSAPGHSRYRYFTSAPATMVLRLGDLAASLPKEVCSEDSDPDRMIEISCAEIFRGPVPKLSLSYLAGLAPECFRSEAINDAAQVRLPAGRLALSYRMIASSELIEPEIIEPLAPDVVAQDFSAPANEKEIPEEPLPVNQVVPEFSEEMAPAGPTVEPVPAPEDLTATDPVEKAESSPAAILRTTVLPINKRPFPILPIFRRREAEPEKPAPPPAVTRFEIPKPKAPLVPLVPPSEFPESFAPVGESESTADFPTSEPLEGIPDLAPSTMAEEEPPWEAPEALLIETEHLPKLGEDQPAEIPDQDALQAVFMTEEMLGMDRVIELCGNLPGVKSCVLSQGSSILAAYNVPDTIDLVSLSGHALEMLGTMRESAAKMGIGTVPAVTLHSEKGPITFFNQEDICMLVLHKDRGFIPGVREKLQNVVEALSRANLPLPAAPGQPRLEW